MMDVSAYSESYPSPATTADDIKESSQPPSEQPSKKKRKAWGQPVPEIKQILPPRKRAKTAEEKEQRKNERILRNRRAADKSRQRQKAAVAELEARQNRIVQENASLRELLARYQSRFGVQSDFPAPAPAPAADSSMLDLDVASTPIELKSDSPFTPSSYETPQPQHPTLVPSDNTTPIKQESPVLAPQLNIINQHIEAEQSDSMATYQSFPAVSGLTQYPAVILLSTGDLGFQATGVPMQPDQQFWTQLPPPSLPDFDDISDLLNDNSLADLQPLPDFGTEIVGDLDGTGFLLHPEQFPTNSFFDFDAFDTDQTSGLPHETSEPTTCMQPTHGAPITGSDRPGFAASG
ncbi:transcription factor that binds to CRE motif [Exophiala xenobiotica]